MSSGSYRQVYVRCPFYKHDDGRRRITCEGIVEDSSVALIYQKKADYETQIRVFCCENFEKCEVHRMLVDKYKEE